MQAWSVGAGLAALGFWAFIAIVIWVGVWDSIRKREARHETLRQAMASGHPVAGELVRQLFGSDQRLDRDLKVAALILFAAAPGLGLLGGIIGIAYPEVLFPLLGAAALVLCVATGLLVAGRFAARSDAEHAGWRHPV